VTTVPVTINQDMKALLCRERIDPRYLHAFLRGAKKHLVALADSSAHGTKKVETELLGRFAVCVPPLEEQRTIVETIRSELDALNELTAAASEVQALLEERRAAAVAAATTGQLHVGRTA